MLYLCYNCLHPLNLIKNIINNNLKKLPLNKNLKVLAQVLFTLRVHDYYLKGLHSGDWRVQNKLNSYINPLPFLY